MFEKNDLAGHLALSYFQKIGPATWRRLESHFPQLIEVLWADRAELIRAGLKPELAEEFIAWRRSGDWDKIRLGLERRNIRIATWHDRQYPEVLRTIPAPPPLLYYIGSLDAGWHRNLAVVGSRIHTAYAGRIIEAFIPAAIKAGLRVISGLARGIDTLAHASTLGRGGETWAVLGSGLDHIYPSENRRLADRITERGALISEFPPPAPPRRQNFPRRNRIISGLSRAILIIEAGRASGALITARCALEQGREVLAVPGNIFSEPSRGANSLIGDGATPIMAVEDLLSIFDLEKPA